METIIVFLGIVCALYYGYRLKNFFAMKKLEFTKFTLAYALVRNTIMKKAMNYIYTKRCLYNKVDDAITLAGIIKVNNEKETVEIEHNPKKFYKRLYKEYKKENDFELFINKRFIGIANLLRCYGDTEWNVLEDLEELPA